MKLYRMEAKFKIISTKMHRNMGKLISIICTVIIMVMMLFNPISVKADVFVKGINLNGNAVVIDGNTWISYSSALSNGLSTTSVSTFNNSINWSPTTDANTNSMLNTVIYKSAGSFSMSQTLDNGTYNVYFWLTENYLDNIRSEDIKIEGNTVATGVGKMLKNTWIKYGPYNVKVSDGNLSIDFIRISGDPQCAGFAIYSTDTFITPVIDGWSKVEAENFSSSAFSNMQTNSTLLSVNNDSDWVQYDSLDFHSETNYIQMNVANGGEKSMIQMLVNGSSVDTFTIENTGGWDKFQTQTFKIRMPQNGVNNIKFVCTKNSVDLDWFIFSLKNPSPPPRSSTYYAKPRVINTTDLGADPDDQESMVRVMVTANEFDLEGLIVVTSLWKTTQSSTSMLDQIVNAYGQALPNLQKHADGFPSLEYMQSICKLGQPTFGMAGVGDNKDTDGSNLIIEAVDKDDPRPVWVNLWGGGNTLAQALWKVKNTRSQAQVDLFVSKLRVYDILGQDDAGAWMTKTFPDLFYIRFMGVYSWQPSANFVHTNFQNHGPLGAEYPDKIWSYEGDTPSFLYEYPNGLSDPEQVDWGSWGGRCNLTQKLGPRGMTGGEPYNEAQYDPYFMFSDAPEGGSSISRWSTAINNDLAARMDWSINSSYAGANHHPIAILNTDTTKAVLQISAAAGSNVNLSAVGSSDPDGNELIYSWAYYNEPSSYHGTVTIQNKSSESATVAIPSGAAGKTIHVVLTLHDNGTPNLYAYRRVIIKVTDPIPTQILNLIDSKNSNSINIYPNPVKGEMNIESDTEFNTLKIFNMEGKLVLEKKFNANIKATYLNLNLEKGSYILKLYNNRLSTNSKFVID